MKKDAAYGVPSGVRQLFLDDCGIAKVENLTRAMHEPVKKGAVIRPDCAAGVWGIQTRAAPMVRLTPDHVWPLLGIPWIRGTYLLPQDLPLPDR